MKLSRLNRLSHMYVALFLTPWLLMYLFSTLYMSHREHIKPKGSPIVKWEKVKEQKLSAQFGPDTPDAVIARRILTELDMSGNFRTARGRDPKNPLLFIALTRAIVPGRVTYNPAAGTALVERQDVGIGEFLENFHRRRGYSKESLAENPWTFVDDAWAGSVDVTIIAMLFWTFSGLWLWWELKETRRLGALFAAGGLAVFGLLVLFL